MLFNAADQGAEGVRVTKSVFLDLVENSLEVRIDSVRAISMGMTKIFDIFGKVSKEKNIVFSDFTSNFDL